MSELQSPRTSTSLVVPPPGVAGLAGGEFPAAHPILTRARERAPTTKPGYAGNVTPQEAWELVSSHVGVLVDVRTAEERQFVGRVPDSIHVRRPYSLMSPASGTDSRHTRPRPAIPPDHQDAPIPQDRPATLDHQPALARRTCCSGFRSRRASTA
jgi:rhodanese-related sulfurtransferase